MGGISCTFSTLLYIIPALFIIPAIVLLILPILKVNQSATFKKKCNISATILFFVALAPWIFMFVIPYLFTFIF